jgi:threonine dehydrogenase-like Zn-dependent dehydrogenase
MNKSIVFTAPGVAEVLDEKMPTVEKGTVIIKLVRSTISAGTERANLVGDPNVTIGDNIVPFPRRSGYSSVGIVTEVGEGVTSVAVGDRVGISWSTHSAYIKVPESNVHKLSDDISDAAAALVHIATFSLAAIRKCRLETGESAIVMGMGVLGMIAVQLLKISGAAPIIAVDPVPEKRALAIKLGADYALDPFASDFTAKVKQITCGGVNVAIEVTGNGGALNGVLDCMAKFGRIALLGCTRSSDFTVDYYKKVHGPGITLIGAHTLARPKNDSSNGWWTERDDYEALIKLVKFGRLNLESLVEEVHSPHDAPQVYKRLASGGGFPVVQFDWSKI